jgi:hypothetical protein
MMERRRRKLIPKGQKVIRNPRTKMRMFVAEVIHEETLNVTLVHLQNQMTISILYNSSKAVLPT